MAIEMVLAAELLVTLRTKECLLSRFVQHNVGDDDGVSWTGLSRMSFTRRQLKGLRSQRRRVITAHVHTAIETESGSRPKRCSATGSIPPLRVVRTSGSYRISVSTRFPASTRAGFRLRDDSAPPH